MLKLTADPEFTAEVQITVPGRAEPAPVQITYKYMSKPEVEEFLALSKGLSDDEACRQIVRGWGEGIDAKFTPENLDTFLASYHAAAFEIVMAYFRELTASRVKN